MVGGFQVPGEALLGEWVFLVSEEGSASWTNPRLWAGAACPRAGGDAQQAWTLTGSVEFGPGARAD